MKTYLISIAVMAWIIVAIMLFNLSLDYISAPNTIQNVIAPFINVTTVFITIFIYKQITKKPKQDEKN